MWVILASFTETCINNTKIFFPHNLWLAHDYVNAIAEAHMHDLWGIHEIGIKLFKNYPLCAFKQILTLQIIKHSCFSK